MWVGKCVIRVGDIAGTFRDVNSKQPANRQRGWFGNTDDKGVIVKKSWSYRLSWYLNLVWSPDLPRARGSLQEDLFALHT